MFAVKRNTGKWWGCIYCRMFVLVCPSGSWIFWLCNIMRQILALLLGSNVKARSNLAFCKNIVFVKCNGCFATHLLESKDFCMTQLMLVLLVRNAQHWNYFMKITILLTPLSNDVRQDAADSLRPAQLRELKVFVEIWQIPSNDVYFSFLL